ncbi:hypothetical protein [Micromonospora sp. WMMD998]|uniref:hypothetical protein n=1 Tax=Micromonospora sp. WMMD998 TaxID=3016092 RepID=UPI00249BE167|nr:hypothetical protein [Micromonospora sp. WMMD998]WFE39356.1 hypothetical protein O7619_13370 [Micromonospora sp. WMMD998]
MTESVDGSTPPPQTDEPAAPVEQPVPTAVATEGGDRGGREGASGADGDHGKRDPKQIAEVINLFYERVSTQTIGKSGGRGKATRRAAIGKLADDEIRAETRYYCRPDGYEEALRRLTADHVVILCGATGLGKRASGINLLRAVTEGQLVVISAVSDHKDLSTRSYRSGYGYLIVNRTEVDRVDDLDFAWRTVRDQVRRAGAYLVTTTVVPADDRVESVGQLTWRRPDLRAVARVHLAVRDFPEDAIERIVGQFHDECSMTDVVAVMSRICDGEKPKAALSKLTETSARRVRDWFDGHKKDLTSVLDVAALALLGEVTHREFESLRAGLEVRMRQHGVTRSPAAGGRQKKAEREEDDLDRRRQRLSDEGLITERWVAGRTWDRRVLSFRNDSYRRHVLRELSCRFETPFWNATAEWLTEIVAHGSDAEIGVGLALLAAADFDEVEHSYLTPWSKGLVRSPGQVTAVFILWAMCLSEDTMPTALKVIKQWANHGDPEQRWTAAMAYSGEAGSCDPTQAIKQLWHLIVASAKGFEQACFAMAALFDTLLDTDDAGKVLSTLERQMHRVPERRVDRVIAVRARRVLAELLVMRENRHRVPVTFLYLDKYPERVADVARLWAEGIRFRPHRSLVLQALWHGLNQLGHISDDPLGMASRLGEALVSALPADEVAPFYEDLRTVNSWRRGRGKQDRSPALVLLGVVGRYYRPRQAEKGMV